MLTATYNQVNARLQALRFRSNQDGEKWRRAVKEHEQMIEALAARDAAAMREVLLTHLQQQARRGARAAAPRRRRQRGRAMNAPLPLKVARDLPGPAYDRVAQASNEVAGRLAQRLASETQGEVLFSPADRGRYATDASIYQVMPVGVFVPRSGDDVRLALDICRDLRVPIVPRGGGTSQCGQTVGAGLVIDHSKHVRSILHFDATSRTAEVEPGMVLDHLNAALKKLGLWYPVDVSTSAQATLGGMAGNNSCGSRSIAYGNMVHNVLGAKAWTADGALHRFERYEDCVGHARDIGRRVKDLAATLAPEIERRWPKVLRRVGGYNLDIFHNQSERPYTGDGSVNLAHLLVGSEGTLALTKSLTLQLAELPRAKVLGVVNFPTFYKAMDSAQHIVKLGNGPERRGTLTAVELVDRTMIELSLQNPAFAPGHPHGRDRPARRRPAGGVFRRRQGGAGAQARPAGRADGRPGPARLGGAHGATTRRRRTCGKCARPASTS